MLKIAVLASVCLVTLVLGATPGISAGRDACDPRFHCRAEPTRMVPWHHRDRDDDERAFILRRLVDGATTRGTIEWR